MTNPGANGSSFSHLIGQLDQRLARIEVAIDRLSDETEKRHDRLSTRLSDLEQSRAETRGGWTVLGVIGGVTGTLGGIASRWFA